MKRRVVAALLACVLAFTCASGCGGVRPGGTAADTAVPAVGRAATLVRVVDGDTIWVRFDDGALEKLRYIGLDAPEVAHEGRRAEGLADEARAHNEALLSLGPLRLVTDVEERDGYGRLLAYVWAGGVLVNERMIRDGYAWAHRYAPNLTLQERLWQAQQAAQEEGLGLWATD